MKTERIWLKNYPKGVPADIAPLQFSSIGEMLASCFKAYGKRTAQTFAGKKFTYAQYDEYSANIASYLQSIGLKKGDHIAIMMPNLPQFTIIAAGILRAGFVLVNVNPMYTAHELKYQLNDAEVKAIFIVENFASTLATILPETPVRHIVTTEVGDLFGGVKAWAVNKIVKFKGMVPDFNLPLAVSFNEALLTGEFHLPEYKEPNVQPDDIAVLQYTGGTTGVSKGAILLHRNLLSNVVQTYEWILPALKTLIAEEDQLVLIGALPLYHIFAFTINFLTSFYIGGNNILIADPRNMSGMLRDMRRQKFHVLPAVNTLFGAILNHPEANSVDWSSLRLSVAGGMSIQQATAKAWHDLTGSTMVEGYGMSETSPLICATRVEVTLDKSAAQQLGIGHPVPSTEIVLLDDNDNPVSMGESGELCVRGPQVMAGYWNAPEETAKTMTKDGYLRTGDIAVMDENGWFRIVDRKKDMILVSGFNVYPNEVEDAVALLDGVAECVAVGVPNEKSGEAVAILIVKKDPNLTVEQVKEWCKTHLTGYKRPRYILFRDELPKSAVGKILRRELRPILDETMAKKDK